MPSVQESVRERIVLELKAKLNTDLDIKTLHFQPFNRIKLGEIKLNDRENNKILIAEQLYASVELLPLLNNQIVISTVSLNNFEFHLSKETQDSPTNIQFIIDAFKSEDKKKKKSFDVTINSLNVNNGVFWFDIKDKPFKNDQFDKNHIFVNDLNANFALKSITVDSLNIQIKRLSLKEKSGIEIKNLITRVISQENKIHIKGFKLELAHSLLQFDKCIIDLTNALHDKNPIRKAHLQCEIISSHITPKDVSSFTPLLKNFTDRIFLKGKVEGTLDDLNVVNLSLDYGDKMTLDAKAHIKNLTSRDSLFLSGNIDRLDVNTDGIRGLINNFSGKNKELPQAIINMGGASFKGSISGYLKKLNAYGLLSSQLGEVSTDIIFGFNPNSGIESFLKGKIHTSKFGIGKLIDNTDLNLLSFDLFVDLKKQKNKKTGGNIKGEISQFDYKGYTYQSITLDALYDGQKLEGEAKIDDENIFLDIIGKLNLAEKQPELNFSAKLRNFRADMLNLSTKYDNSFLSLDVNANFKGTNIDDAQGYINVDSLRFYRNDESFTLDKLTVQATDSEEGKKLEISSDIVNGEVTGIYSFSTLTASLKKSLANYLPALIPNKEIKNSKIKENNLRLDFTISNTEKLSNILSLPFTAYSEIKIEGVYNNLREKFQLEVYYPSVKIAGTVVKSGYLSLETKDNTLYSSVKGILTGKNNIQNNILLNLTAKEDNINSDISFTNNSKQKFEGKFTLSSYFTRDEKKNELYTDINIHESNLVLNDTAWQITESKILLQPGLFIADNINIHNAPNSQYVNIDGMFSKNSDEVLQVDLKNINLDYLFNTLAIDALNFGGFASGSLQAMSIDGTPYIKADIRVNEFAFNNTRLGYLQLHSELDDENKWITLNGTLLDDEKRKTDIHGHIKPETQELSINFDADKVNIAFLNKYASSLFNDIKGLGSGKVELFGDFSNVTVMGKAFIENGSLGINFLNTRYSFTDTIYLKKDLIYFNDIKFYDQNKNEATISGKVVHDYFSDFMYYVDLNGSNFMLYNASEKLNPMFHGTLYGSGTGSISGDERAVNIDAQLRTDKGSRIRMNFMEETINEYSFITYKNSDSIQSNTESAAPKALNALKTESGIDINMNFYVDATPEAVVEIVMDPVGGDVLRSTGSGALQFVWGSKTDPRLYGTYVINNGSYNFTFQKIIERKFSIETGSTVLFRGDPFQADINVNAIYKLNANLNDLDTDLARNSGQTSIPVECILNITGQLQHPNVALDVALPTADAEVQRQVKSLMNNEDMVNRQMVYLLLLSKFYTPDNNRVENKSSDFASLASATLSTQLSKILSTIDERWQFGTHIRTSDGEFTSTEVELLLSSQLLDNRILINGNFGYRDDPSSQIQNALITDVDIEYLINRAGTWRIKGYNHFNEKFYYKSDNSSVQTQGIGIIYKKNFDYVREIFGQKPRYKIQLRNDSVIPILPDSTVKGSSLGDFVKIKQ